MSHQYFSEDNKGAFFLLFVDTTQQLYVLSPPTQHTYTEIIYYSEQKPTFFVLATICDTEYLFASL